MIQFDCPKCHAAGGISEWPDLDVDFRWKWVYRLSRKTDWGIGGTWEPAGQSKWWGMYGVQCSACKYTVSRSRLWREVKRRNRAIARQRRPGWFERLKRRWRK